MKDFFLILVNKGLHELDSHLLVLCLLVYDALLVMVEVESETIYDNHLIEVLVRAALGTIYILDSPLIVCCLDFQLL